jgi:nicotinamidase-related amidase
VSDGASAALVGLPDARLGIVFVGCQSFLASGGGRSRSALRWVELAHSCLVQGREAQVLIFHVQLSAPPVAQSTSWKQLQQEEPLFRFPDPESPPADFISECAPSRAAIEPVVECYRPNAFADTRLPLLLRSNGVTDVVLVGPHALPAILPSAIGAACSDLGVSVIVTTPTDVDSESQSAAFAALRPWARVLTPAAFRELMP